ncbi:hypothetical protein Tco_1383032, partial [Tanacetum coccineum]
ILGKLTHSKMHHVDIVPVKTTPTHIDLWVDYMWHGRPDNANWAMVSCYFVEILLQNNTPLFYANGDKYDTSWSDVNQDYELEKCRELMKSISETQLKVLKKISFIAKLRRAKAFDKKGIDPTDYCIRFKLADNVAKHGGIFGDCGV